MAGQCIPPLLRLKQIVGDPKSDPPVPPIVPISRSGFLSGVRAGRFPAPVKLSPRVSVWSGLAIQQLVDELLQQQQRGGA